MFYFFPFLKTEIKSALLILLIVFTFILRSAFVFSQVSLLQQCNGPFGGTAITFFSNTQGKIFAGTYSGGGMYVSSNNGVNWNKAIDGFNVVNSIIQGTSGRLFAGVNKWIYLSTNSGSNWTPFHEFNYSPRSLCCTPSGVILAGGWYGQIYRSTDNGITWSTTELNGMHSKIISNSSYVYLNADNRLYRSGNNGGSWDNIYYIGSSPYINDLAFDMHGYLMLVFANAILKSTNNGINWVNMCNITNMLCVYTSSNGTIYAGNTNGKIYKTTNEGNLWTEIYSNPGGHGIYSIYSRNDGYVFAGVNTNGIVVSSNNGANWSRYTNGITNQRVENIETDNSGNIYAATSGDGLFKTTNRGSSWNRIAFEYRVTSQLKILPNGVIYVKTNESGSGVFKSTDSGNSWVSCSGFRTSMNVNTLCTTTMGTMYIGSSDSGLYKSTNEGNNWFLCAFNNKSIVNLFIDNGNRIFISIETVFGYEAYFSSNSGLSWVQMDPNIFYRPVNKFIKSPSGIVYAGLNFESISPGILCKSTNNGINWINIYTFNTKSIAVNALNYIYISDGTNIQFSIDEGENWIEIEMPECSISDLCLESSGYLYVSTLGACVFRSTISTIGVRKISSQIPYNFFLYQNYPNPFNPATNIDFDIQSLSDVKIRIFNVLGREIDILLNKKLKPGKYSVVWKADNAPSGIYFCRMECDRYLVTRRMILIK